MSHTRKPTGKYVRVDNFQGALLADRTEIGTTEEVTLVQTGSTIAFKGPNNQFIGAEPSGKIMANRVSLGPSNHMLLSLAPNQTLVLKQGKYVSSSYGTAVTCKADTVGTEECFKVETSEGRSAFRNAFDKYVSVEANRSVHATRSVAGLNEQFVIELHEGGCIALKSAAHRVYLGVDMSGQVVATSNKVGPSEKFVFNPHY